MPQYPQAKISWWGVMLRFAPQLGHFNVIELGGPFASIPHWIARVAYHNQLTIDEPCVMLPPCLKRCLHLLFGGLWSPNALQDIHSSATMTPCTRYLPGEVPGIRNISSISEILRRNLHHEACWPFVPKVPHLQSDENLILVQNFFGSDESSDIPAPHHYRMEIVVPFGSGKQVFNAFSTSREMCSAISVTFPGCLKLLFGK